MQFRPGVLLKMFRDARQQSLSLRWKLAVWLIMLGCTLVVLVFFVFNLIGIVNPIERQIETMLFNQLDRTVSDIRHDTDDWPLGAYPCQTSYPIQWRTFYRSAVCPLTIFETILICSMKFSRKHTIRSIPTCS